MPALKTSHKTSLACAALALCLLSGCKTTSVQDRFSLANSIAAQGGMSRLSTNTDNAPFALPVQSLVRINEHGARTRVYIEGDGLAFLSRTRQSPDPTPTNPVALRLAAADSSQNVVWLGRACQYVTNREATQCHPQYWTYARFAPKAVAAVNAQLDALKQQYNIPEFELIGFSGGGAVAALIAAERADVTCLRSVAGNLDHRAFTEFHTVPPMTESLNPAVQPARLRTLPQHHYVGADDKIVPEIVAQSYKRKIAPTGPFSITVIQGATHEDGWLQSWPSLVQKPCE